MLSSVGPPRRTGADVPLTALNCIVVFSATKVDKIVPAPCRDPATLMPSQRPQPDGSEPQLASMLTSAAWVAWLVLAACSEVEGDSSH
jgi:hypothetical protein